MVLQDKLEEEPSRAIVTDLASGDEFTLDGSSDVPTTNGGTWALGDGHLLHATIRKRSYCIASVDRRPARPPSAGAPRPARLHRRADLIGRRLAHDVRRLPSLLPHGRPAGRHLHRAVPGVPDCHGSEGVLTGTARSGPWSPTNAGSRAPTSTPAPARATSTSAPEAPAPSSGAGTLRTSAATLSAGVTTPP